MRVRISWLRTPPANRGRSIASRSGATPWRGALPGVLRTLQGRSFHQIPGAAHVRPENRPGQGTVPPDSQIRHSASVPVPLPSSNTFQKQIFRMRRNVSLLAGLPGPKPSARTQVRRCADIILSGHAHLAAPVASDAPKDLPAPAANWQPRPDRTGEWRRRISKTGGRAERR